MASSALSSADIAQFNNTGASTPATAPSQATSLSSADFGNPITQTMNSIQKMAQTPIATNLENTGAGAANLLANVGRNISSVLPNPIADSTLNQKLGITGPSPTSFFQSLQAANNNLPGVNPNSSSYSLGSIGAGALLPLGEFSALGDMASAGLSPVAEGIGSLFPSLASKAALGAKAISGAIPAATSGAIGGALTSNPGQMGASALTGAGLGAGLQGLVNAPKLYANAKFNNLANRASNFLAGARSPSDVAALNEQLGNEPVNFGTAVGNTGLQNSINFLTRSAPFSPAKNYAAILVGHGDKAANDLLSQFSQGVDPAAASQTVANNVQDNFTNTTKQSTNNYNAFLNSAKPLGPQAVQYPQATALAPQIAEQLFSPTSPMNGASKVFAHIKQFLPPPVTDAATNTNTINIGGNDVDISTLPANIQEQLISKNALPTAQEQEPFVPPQTSFASAHSSNGRMAEDIRNFQANGQGTAANLLGQFKSAVGNDIENSADALNSNVANQWRAANAFHQSDVLPYQSPDIQKIINGKSNLKSISTTLLNSNNADVLDDFTPQQKNNLIYAHFLNNAGKQNSQGIPQVTAASMYGAYNKIPEEVKPRLFTPDQMDAFNQLKAFNEVTPEAKIMLNAPPTGVRSYLAKAKELAIGALAAGGGAAAHFGMGVAGLPVTGALGALGYGVNKLAQFAHSPGLREAYANGGYALNPNVLQNILPKTALMTGLQARNLAYSNNQ